MKNWSLFWWVKRYDKSSKKRISIKDFLRKVMKLQKIRRKLEAYVCREIKKNNEYETAKLNGKIQRKNWMR